LNNRRPSGDDALADDEKSWMSMGQFNLQALAASSPFMKTFMFFMVTALTFSALWGVWLGVSLSHLEIAQSEEIKLREVLALKLLKAAKFEPLKNRRSQILRDIETVELPLSRKGDMAGLLKDINRIGLSRGLQFELFRPELEAVRTHYVELPISLRVTGRYRNLGLFAADMASTSSLVTLDNLLMTPMKDGNLVLEATLHAYRHLEDEDRPILKKASVDPSEAP
jgi:type IV pilus assembly protein PilO